MRIDLSLPGGAAVESGRSSNTAAARPDGRGQHDVLGLDEARLSSDQSNLRGLELRLSQMSDVRGERVEALRKQVAEGTYRVDTNHVADALTRDLVGSSTRG
jgi:flagellar biosynthesis anti-sigma factor FlgM